MFLLAHGNNGPGGPVSSLQEKRKGVLSANSRKNEELYWVVGDTNLVNGINELSWYKEIVNT